ncbi:AAA family ATPase [Clostridium thermarum]|uniref:AAA family ATPase n=1 Tax=Clostridium thermarum TaxID=1716543 RepID=UPI0013D249B5|nr:AAA family ATPase [Clostridium thermarum]
MSKAIMYGTFVKYGMRIYRAATYLQWGNSENIIGACVMCNPGIAALEARGLYIHGPINEGREFIGVIKPDEAILHVIKFVEKLYQGEKLEGTLYIYNLFSLLDAPSTIFELESAAEEVNREVLFKGYRDYILNSDKIPWTLLAWGCDNRKAVYKQKVKWLNYIKKNNIPYFGIEAVEYPGYVSLRQQGNVSMGKYMNALLKEFKLKNLTLKGSDNKLECKDDQAREIKRLKTLNKIFDFIQEKKKITPEEIAKGNINLLEAKQYKMVLAKCNEALKLDDRYLPIYIQRAQALEELKEDVEAVKTFGEALIKTKEKALQYLYDAKLAEYRGEKEKAKENYLKTLDAVESSQKESINNINVLYYIYFTLGKYLEKIHNYEEAVQYIDKAIELRKTVELSEFREQIARKLWVPTQSINALQHRDHGQSEVMEAKDIKIPSENVVNGECNDDTNTKASLSANKDKWFEIKKKLDSLIGLENVKRELYSIMNYLNYERDRSQVLNLSEQNLSYHFMFTGNPGTGKTTIARLLGEILVQAGVLTKGHVVEVDRSKIVGQYVGQTAVLTGKAIESAMDGILFIDEAYSLYRSENPNDYGIEAVDTLVKAMEDNRGKLVVILAGYSREINKLMQANPGLKSRINVQINFEDYTEDQLLLIAKKMAGEKYYEMDESAVEAFKEKIRRLMVDTSFANGRTVRNVVEDAIREKAYRTVVSKASQEELKKLSAVDFGSISQEVKEREVNSILGELNKLIGLKEVKASVKEMIDFIHLQKRRKELGYRNEEITLNMVFTGNPGTGKTTVARLISRLFKEIGILKRGQLVEATREDLVGEYIGQTSSKTLDKIKEAYGGVFFIDEAYTLAQGGDNDYGKEALATLIKEMEDNRDKLMVILAGYTEEIEELLNLNPGIKSRVGFTIHFPDYSPDELMEIFKIYCLKNDYILEEKAERFLYNVLKELYSSRDKSFGNARLVRQLFERIRMKQANRIMTEELAVGTSKEVITIKEEDICQ